MPPQRRARDRDGQPESSRQRRRDPEPEEPEDSEEDQEGSDVEMERPGDNTDEQLVTKLVRYALACEYARIPIRRDGIREKVLGSNARSFKRVFEEAQKRLQEVFGMEMTELPAREKRTLREKQKATQRGGPSQTTTTKSYILTSTLPAAYRSQPIISPSRIPSSKEEAEYIGFYTMAICLIVLSGGELSDHKLRRHLNRLNAAQNLPMDKTENVLAKLVRQTYLDKIVEKSNDEDLITWCVGSRGKLEVPPTTIASVVREVWGELPEDFDEKLSRSLGLTVAEEQEGGEVATNGDNA